MAMHAELPARCRKQQPERLLHILLHVRPAAAAPASGGAAKSGDWGRSAGYPATPVDHVRTGEGLDDRRKFRVGNYSGGYDRLFPFHTIKAAAGSAPSQLSVGATHQQGFSYAWGSAQKRLEEFIAEYPVTGLLIARRGEVFVEHYAHARDASMRFQSWSMAKSVTALLLGICLDRGLIASLDDPAQCYVPQLKGTLHGVRAAANPSIALSHPWWDNLYRRGRGVVAMS
jgi:hypothetical protein